MVGFLLHEREQRGLLLLTSTKFCYSYCKVRLAVWQANGYTEEVQQGNLP